MSVGYAEGVQGQIAPETAALLLRPTDGSVHFSDVFSATPVVGGQFWRSGDFDVDLTVHAESKGSFPDLEKIPIGERPWVVPYGLVLVDDLVRARAARVEASLERVGGNLEALHPDDRAEVEASKKAVVALANYAPRDDQNTEGGQNGSDFYIAITDAGTEYVVTPLSFLSALDARNRIVALYKAPNKNHPAFDGEHEQFRSARVERSRRSPDHLVPIFEYGSREELIAAKEAGEHPSVIPRDTRTGHIAFVDKFGNVRIESQDAKQIQALKVGRAVTFLVRNQGETHRISGVTRAEDLKHSPREELATYANCSDHNDKENGGSTSVSYVELVSRVNGNPSLSTETAIHKLLRVIPNLDIATAEVELILEDEEPAVSALAA